MCGRVVASIPRDYLASFFGAEAVGLELPPSYNVAPGASLYAVASVRDGGLRLGTMRWGLVAPWAVNPDEGPRPINARAESLFDRAMFTEALERGRTCVLPVAGFFEWETTAAGKQPHLLTAPDGLPLALAGLWSRWAGPGQEPVLTCTIVTTAANADVAPLHDRMPVLLTPDTRDVWLARNVDPCSRAQVLVPAPAASLVARPVSTRVNDARNDDPDLLCA